MELFGGVATSPDNLAIIEKVFNEADKHAVKALTDDKDEDGLELWQVHYAQLTKSVIAGRKKLGMRYDKRIPMLAIGLLARTSSTVYDEIAAVMQLPTHAHVLAEQKKLVDTKGTWAYGVCMTTIESLDKQLTEQGFAQWGDERIGFIAFDSAEERSGLGWDHTSLRYTGIDAAMNFKVVLNQFKVMAKEDGKGAEAVDDKEDMDADILDQIKLSKHHFVFKWTSLHPNLKRFEVMALSA